MYEYKKDRRVKKKYAAIYQFVKSGWKAVARIVVPAAIPDKNIVSYNQD